MAILDITGGQLRPSGSYFNEGPEEDVLGMLHKPQYNTKANRTTIQNNFNYVDQSMDDYSSDETLTSPPPFSLPPVTVTHVDESLPSTSSAHDSTDDHMDSPVADDCFDAEERRIARFMSEGCKGCKCKLNGRNACITRFTASQLSAARDECRQLTHDQLDMVVMGQLCSLCQTDTVTQRTATFFRFAGHRICLLVFLFMHTMSHKRFEAIKHSWSENGLCSRVRSKVLPHNTTKLSDIEKVVKYILQYAEEHAILLPGQIPGYKRDDLQLLPSSTTKRQVWDVYHTIALKQRQCATLCFVPCGTS